MKKYGHLAGNYEEPGVIGTRVEITGNSFTVLWMGSVVLETKFSANDKNDGSTALTLKNCGLRYAGAASDYAEITSVVFRDGKLTVAERFPITGDSVRTLSPTENNRYGNYDFADAETVPLLQGKWVSDGPFALTFAGDRVTCGGDTVKYRVLRPRWDPAKLILTDADPGKRGLFWFCDVTFAGDAILATVPVCDAPQISMVFRRA